MRRAPYGIDPVLSTATSGLRAASLRANNAASNIVNINTPGYTATTVSQGTVRTGGNIAGGSGINAQIIATELGPDLGEEIIQLIEAETVYRANARVLETASDLSRDTLDIIT